MNDASHTIKQNAIPHVNDFDLFSFISVPQHFHRGQSKKMPKVRRMNRKPPRTLPSPHTFSPLASDFALIEPTLQDLAQKMREAEIKSHEGLKRSESTWPIFRLHHQRTRYIYELFHKRKSISKELYL